MYNYISLPFLYLIPDYNFIITSVSKIRISKIILYGKQFKIKINSDFGKADPAGDADHFLNWSRLIIIIVHRQFT